jgi:hemerythrin-like domain-containing protein
MSFSNTLGGEHRACDRAFAAIERAAQMADWQGAETACHEFLARTERHFRYEEETLFPALCKARPMAEGPVAVMRAEHAQVRELATDLAAAVAEHDLDGLRSSAETLMFLLQQHNAKEENVLYPLADDILDPATTPSHAVADR